MTSSVEDSQKQFTSVAVQTSSSSSTTSSAPLPTPDSDSAIFSLGSSSMASGRSSISSVTTCTSDQGETGGEMGREAGGETGVDDHTPRPMAECLNILKSDVSSAISQPAWHTHYYTAFHRVEQLLSLTRK